MQYPKNALPVVLAVLLTGCAGNGYYANVPVEDAGSQSGAVYESAGYPPKPSSPELDQRYPEPEYTAPSYPEPEAKVSATSKSDNSAVIALLGTAEKQRLSGDYASAAVSLERAIRITPRDPELYYQLALVRYFQGNHHQTEQLCRKAISLAVGDKELQKRCRSLLSKLG